MMCFLVCLSVCYGITATHRNRGAAADTVIIPCDAVIVQGGCVTNEAMLTGESVPQTKEALQFSVAVDGKPLFLDFAAETAGQNASLKRNMVFGGTALLKHSTAEIAVSNGASNGKQQGGHASYDIPLSPDYGCVAIVVRTGFATTQVISGSMVELFSFFLLYLYESMKNPSAA
jgi:cation-transporting ATPase 13A1